MRRPGGVGSVLVQMARAAGAGRIFATAGSAAKLEIARGFGADVAIDYTKDDFSKIVLEATGKSGVDVICRRDRRRRVRQGHSRRSRPSAGMVIYGQSGGHHGALSTD